MGLLVTREAAKKMDDSLSANTSGTPASAQDLDNHNIAPLHGDPEDDQRQEQQDATPRRNPSRAQQQRRPEQPEIENVLTQLTQEILTMRREVAANQMQQAQHADVSEDPNFNWALLKLPADTKFPVPGIRIVQRIAADLLARLLTRDQHDARFVLPVISDWDDLDDEMRNIAFQRLNIYTIVATYGWPTAIASSLAVQATPSNYLLTYYLSPPGVIPVQNQRANNNNQQRGGRHGNQQHQQAAAPATAPAQAPAPAPARGRGRRQN